ncbi:helix-turn-helix domain-containing protein [Pontibacter qinzhouensis]|uniref:Helix-turn-helix domain-containing protein n=1 Tax=Pontibacter qinzhouensis TaxID=2603253 RepID=A0A5C8JKY1_9BACT|nr:helix-turn-helix domain-containing protein [Pontibacter qinzhouensis]
MGLYDQPGRGRKPLLTAPERERVWLLVRESPRRIGQHLVTLEQKLEKRISHSTLKRTLWCS